MDPWTILGWLVLAAIAGGAGLMLFAFVAVPAYLHWCHMRTRDVPPATGQIWLQPAIEPGFESERLTIIETLPTGNLRIRTSSFGRMEWIDTPGMWERRVRARKLILVEKGE